MIIGIILFNILYNNFFLYYTFYIIFIELNID